MQEQLIKWLLENWMIVITGLWVAEKIVKMTPTKYDDICIDIIGGALKKLAGKKDENAA